MGGFHIIKIITSFCVTFKGAFEQKPQFSCCENYQNPFAEKNYYVHIGLTQQPPLKVESVQFIGHEMLYTDVNQKNREGNQYGSSGGDYICRLSGTVQDRGAVPGLFIPAAVSERV